MLREVSRFLPTLSHFDFQSFASEAVDGCIQCPNGDICSIDIASLQNFIYNKPWVLQSDIRASVFSFSVDTGIFGPKGLVV